MGKETSKMWEARSPEDVATPCCGYQELSPHEFDGHKEMVVVLLRTGHAAGEFEGFQELVVVTEAQQVVERISAYPAGQPVGLVCPDGECSGRLAVRLSKQGFRVYHLGGGLLEWYHNFRSAKACSA